MSINSLFICSKIHKIHKKLNEDRLIAKIVVTLKSILN